VAALAAARARPPREERLYLNQGRKQKASRFASLSVAFRGTKNIDTKQRYELQGEQEREILSSPNVPNAVKQETTHVEFP
jgi:hypothetical protein